MKTSNIGTLSRFNFLKNAKISQKVKIIFAVLLTGFLILGGSFGFIFTAEKNATTHAEQTADLGLLIANTNTELLQARRYEKDFLLHKDKKYIDNFQTVIASTQNHLNEIRNLYPKVDNSNKMDTLLDNISKGLEYYKKSFLEVAESWKTLGLNENLGLQGKLRNAIHAAEKDITSVNDTNLLSSMLMLRRHEKDFILRENDKYIKRFDNEINTLLKKIDNSKLSNTLKSKMAANLATYQEAFHDFAKKTFQTKSDINSYQAVYDSIRPDFITLTDNIKSLYSAEQDTHHTSQLLLALTFGITLVLVSVITLFSIYLFAKGLITRLFSLQDTINDVSSGNFDARSTLTEKDELGVLAHAFNNLLDDRVAHLARAEKENNMLNDSIVRLLQAVSVLSQKDLTMKVPVTEDVTGPIADALNLMASETSKVLNGVQKISEEVAETSSKVKFQSDNVVEMATTGRTQIEKTAQELSIASATMNSIAELAQETNLTADKTINTSKKAMEIVSATVDGINGIRDTISETEKRIKRLGERSQEISGVVGLINTIAERTHILALNASMHAASAGEAGRGFAVVADEVQRLAENAREATGQISTLVSNIQIETADTVTTMNNVISQVVEGSKLAEQAGLQMSETQHSTEELVSFVQKIASDSQQQAEIARQLVERANEISKNTEETSASMLQQTENTNRLVNYSDGLLKAVQVFKLPTTGTVQ